MDTEEKLLVPEMGRFCLFPIRRPDLYAFYEASLRSFWTADELDLSREQADFKKLSADEQHFIKMVLGFFASSDGIIQENLAANFLAEVQYSEARLFYSYQIFNEAEHSRTYSLLIDTVISDQPEKDRLFNAITQVPTVAQKAKWALQWLSPSRASFAERLVAFACVELVQFASSFASIFWLKQKHPGLMQGLCTSNEFIARDETQHGLFACHLYRHHVQNKLQLSRIFQIVAGCVEVERRFVRESLPVALLGLNATLMEQYVEYAADGLLQNLGLTEKLYGVAKCPLPFMEQLGVVGKTNFFEKRVSEYARAPAPSTEEWGLDQDF